MNITQLINIWRNNEFSIDNVLLIKNVYYVSF